MNTRYTELDALRGLAVLSMILYHLLFDLSFFYGFAFDVRSGVLGVGARLIASVFLILVGIGSAISLSRSDDWVRRSIQRSIMILAFAFIVTGATSILTPDGYVRFGILHLIGVSALLLPLFWKLKKFNLLFGMLLILISPFLLDAIPVSMFALPLGKTPPLFMVDYYPLLPWFGVVLIGLGLGHMLYLPERKQWIPAMNKPTWLQWMGRRALFFYMVHQPVLIGSLWMVLGSPT